MPKYSAVKNPRVLFRPVGLREWELIEAADCRAFPPRLEWQPIFYPVLRENYAIRIARDWNTQDPNSGYVGIVTRFEVPEDLAARYEVQCVGDEECLELWVPAADLALWNSQLLGRIRPIHRFDKQ